MLEVTVSRRLRCGGLSKRVMFDIGICEAKQVVLIRFTGELTESDFARLDRMAGNARGNAEFDCIFDFTAVERIDLAAEFVARRGELPQAFKNRERIYVVPQDDLKLLTRLYAAYQTAKGWRAPSIVATLDEALIRLGVARANFSSRPDRLNRRANRLSREGVVGWLPAIFSACRGS